MEKPYHKKTIELLEYFKSKPKHNNRNNLTLIQTIGNICVKHKLRFGQLIEIIKKEDWFYKTDKEICDIVDNFIKDNEK